MKYKQRICQVCGAYDLMEISGNRLKCRCCDAVYESEKIDVGESERINAFQDAERELSLSPPRFGYAEDQFCDIINKYPRWSAGYWGAVRAKFCIKYETDYDGKAVPSCYASSYVDFRDDEYFKKAIEFAETAELKQKYLSEAERIADVCRIWREEAQRYSYDIFISFKASDNENKETEDLAELNKLYEFLTDAGYKVFFSPITLNKEGLAGKKIEPYIFNALDTAKAMIVYGSKSEYFTSTWVANEWNRYWRAMNKGRKAKNSLIVAYKGFNPKELPRRLREIQALNIDSTSFYSDIQLSLESVFAAQLKPIIPRIDISPNTLVKKINKPTETISVIEAGGERKKQPRQENLQFKTREIGESVKTYTYTPDEELCFSSGVACLTAESYAEAKIFFQECLKINSCNGNAWLGMLCADIKFKKIPQSKLELDERQVFEDRLSKLTDATALRSSIEYAKERETANTILDIVCDIINQLLFINLERAYFFYSICAVYNSQSVFETRDRIIDCCDSIIINENSGQAYNLFLLLTGKIQDTDTYITANLAAAKSFSKIQQFEFATKFVENVLAVDESNVQAIRLKIFASCGAKSEEDFSNNAYKFNDFDFIKNKLSLISKEDAQNILSLLCAAENYLLALRTIENTKKAEEYFAFIIGYKFEGRNDFLQSHLDYIIWLAENSQTSFFDKIYKSENEIDSRIQKLLKFADCSRACGYINVARDKYNEVLNIEENNYNALLGVMYCDMDVCGKFYEKTLWIKFNIKDFEKILSACPNYQTQINVILGLCDVCIDYIKYYGRDKNICCDVFEKLLRYINKEEEEALYLTIEQFANACLSVGEFEIAEHYFELYLQVETDKNYAARYGLLLSRLKCCNEDEFIKCKEFSRDMDEYKALLMSCRNNQSALLRFTNLAKENDSQRNRVAKGIKQYSNKEDKLNKKKRESDYYKSYYYSGCLSISCAYGTLLLFVLQIYNVSVAGVDGSCIWFNYLVLIFSAVGFIVITAMTIAIYIMKKRERPLGDSQNKRCIFSFFQIIQILLWLGALIWNIFIVF